MAVAVQDVIGRIAEFCPLQLAVLFGSQARGTAKAGSDFDVALMPTDPLAPLWRQYVEALEKQV